MKLKHADFYAELEAMQPRDLLIWDKACLEAFYLFNRWRRPHGRVYRSVLHRDELFVVRVE